MSASRLLPIDPCRAWAGAPNERLFALAKVRAA